jgi:CHAD domain-containing protein
MAKAREIEGLDCDGDVLLNIALILRTRMEEMCELRAKALDWSDSEGVHDMRVASRRLRSALRDFAPYFDARKAQRKQLKAVARSLGTVRDEDVAIPALEKLMEGAEEEAVASGIKQLIEERRKRQALARERLEQTITYEAINQFQEKFTARQQSTDAAREKRPADNTSAGLTFRDVGRRVILSRYRELDDLSNNLYSPFDVEPLHEMRIAAKGLRYSIEIFSHCFGDQLMGFAKEIAELQSSLGDLHDCDVWIDQLGARLKARHEHNSRGGASPLTKEDNCAALWLLQHFVKERTKHYRNALARWSEWEATGFYLKLEESLKEHSSPQPAETDHTLAQNAVESRE